MGKAEDKSSSHSTIDQVVPSVIDVPLCLDCALVDPLDCRAEVRFLAGADLKGEDLRELGRCLVSAFVTDFWHVFVVASHDRVDVGSHNLLELCQVGFIRDGRFVIVGPVLIEVSNQESSGVVPAHCFPN